MMHLLLWAGMAAVIPVVVILSGVVPLAASSGHWAVTSFVLDLAKRRSVATWSLGIDAPPLGGEAQVRVGASYFDQTCRPCHGRPGAPAPVVPARMTPHPPELSAQVGRWRPREIFYIVKHGIKFTGMPAWPSARRDDEVWSVVAFLLELPGMDGATYERLVTASEHAPDDGDITRVAATRCATCHGLAEAHRDGVAVPALAGQRAAYLAAALEAYAGGARHSGIMQPIAAGLDRRVRGALAAYYAAIPPARLRPSASVPAGGTLIRDGDPSREVPPCAECHGPSATDRRRVYPVLAGQSASYLRLQLRLFAEGRRGGTADAEVMRDIALRLTDGQMDAAASAYAALGGAAP